MAIRRTSAATTINRGVTAAAATPVNIITGSVGTGATVNISSIQIANSGFTALDDTAVSTAGGYLIINGTGFQSGATVRVQGTAVTSVAFVSSSRLNVTVPAISSGTLDIYVVNPDGSGAILLSGFVSSGVPSWTTTSPLTQQDVDTAFSIQLAATGDGSVTYAVSSGSTLPSGTTLTSNGLFSGTITGLTEETTYTFSVDAIDSQNQDTARTFNITISANDQYYYLTSLHLTGETSSNTWITDASTNKFALTVNGDTKPIAFSPYETVWSNLFDGTGDYLTAPANSTGLDILGSAFTIECWFMLTSTQRDAGLISKFDGSSSGYLLRLDTSIIRFYTNAAVDRSYSFSVGVWYHVAVSYNGTTGTIYVNGVAQGSTFTPGSTNATGSLFQIGRTNTITNDFPGYISNVRVVKGTAVYTSDFTPSTSSLTAITNTSILTCQSNGLIDNSTNNYTLTKNGDVTVTNFGPFTETDITTGSAYFDGTGDYISSTSNTAFTFTGDFTVEYWHYDDGTSVIYPNHISSTDWATGTGGVGLRYNNTGQTGKYTFHWYNVGDPLIASSSTFPIRVWNHVALTRSGSSIRLFVNGTLQGSATNSGTVDFNLSSNGIRIGGGNWDGNNSYMKGYLSDIRMIKGTALYTSAFTPPTTPLTAIANTSLLTLQNRFGENNNRFVDTSGINNVVTRNGNATQGTFSPFSRTGWSNYFDGTGDYLTVQDNSAFAFGTGDFTVEGWYYLNSGVTRFCLYDSGSGGSGGQFAIFQDSATGFFVRMTSDITTTTPPGTDQWVHFAVTRSGTTVRLFFNGTLKTSGTQSTNVTNTTPYIGYMNGFGSYIMNGYISNLRVLKGTALYTSSFTPSTSPLTAIANTSLLTCQSNRLFDSSNNNFTITRNGDTSVQAVSPFKPTSSWSLSTIGGSMYFDGTGDYLTVPDNATLDAFTDFTIEFWVYFNSVSGTQVVLDKGWNGASVAPYLIFHTNGAMVAYASSNGSSWDILGGSSFGTLTAGQWYHIALTRSGSTIRLFKNGSVITTVTNGTTLVNGASALGIGGSPSAGANPLNGQISNLRIVKGAAVYTANTSPPTSPPTPVAGTTLLLNGTNGSIIDYSGRNNLETIGNVKQRNNIVKYGNTSLFFDGTTDYLIIPPTQNLEFGSGDFTIEFWWYPTSTSRQGLYHASFGTDWSLGIDYSSVNTNQKIGIWASSNGTSWNLLSADSGQNGIGTTTVTQNDWNHIAFVRNGTTWMLFVNGNRDLNLTGISGSVVSRSTSSKVIGSWWSTGAMNQLFGYIDDFRITKGYARYTANFTPPTSTFKTK